MNRFTNRPLSYSQLSCFEYDVDEWYRRYVLGEKQTPNNAMKCGTIIGDSIGTPQSLVPKLVPPGIKEFELRANLGEVQLVGYADHYCPDTKVLHENKTSTNTSRWTQSKVDEHTQLTMYALLLALRQHTEPEEVTMYLNFIPVIEGADMHYYLPDPPTFKQFETRRTSDQVCEYADYVLETVEKMEEVIAARQ